MPKPAHRPEHVPTPKDRLMVKVMVAGGIQQTHIAASLGISKPTLRKHYRDEIRSGGAGANGNVVAALYQNATVGKNVVAQIWWTKTRMGWREIHQIEESGPDGKPIENIVTYKWADPPKDK